MIAPNCSSLVSRKYCFHHHYWINFRWTKSFSHFLLKVSFSVVPSNGVQSSCSDACKGEKISEMNQINVPHFSLYIGRWGTVIWFVFRNYLIFTCVGAGALNAVTWNNREGDLLQKMKKRTKLFTLHWKMRDSELVPSFEDGTQLKIPAEVI